MSRLYDRVMAHGCVPLSARDVVERAQPALDALRNGAFQRLAVALGHEPTTEEVAEDVMEILSALGTHQSQETLDPGVLTDAVVVAGDDVGHYFLTLPIATNITDVVSVVAPPFERFFVEFEHVSDNVLGSASWGVLFTQEEPQHDAEGWLLRAILVGEWRKGKPVGPVGTWVLPLDRDGVLFEGDANGYRGSPPLSQPRCWDSQGGHRGRDLRCRRRPPSGPGHHDCALLRPLCAPESIT